MSRYSQVREIERRIRSSIQYSHWVERNRTDYCVDCGKPDELEVHHIIELYHVALGLWKFYGDWEAVFKHAIAMHEFNQCEGVTLCKKCHDSKHPGRAIIILEENLHVDDWCSIPRNLNVRFALGKKGLCRGEVGLLGFQSLMGIGWNIMNGYSGGRIVDFNWRRFAELVGKNPSASFCNGLGMALNSLHDAGIVDGWTQEKNSMEVHLSKAYLENLRANPWFMPLEDVKTSRMTVLVLRWFLGFQANRSSYSIGRDKLATHMQFVTRTPAFVCRCIRESVAEIPWATMDESKDIFRFKFKKRGMVPIYSLRALLVNSLASM